MASSHQAKACGSTPQTSRLTSSQHTHTTNYVLHKLVRSFFRLTTTSHIVPHSYRLLKLTLINHDDIKF